MKKIATALLSCALAAATLAGCAANAAQVPQESQEPHTAALTATAAASVKSPKYVFLFIGDGMPPDPVHLRLPGCPEGR